MSGSCFAKLSVKMSFYEIVCVKGLIVVGREYKMYSSFVFMQTIILTTQILPQHVSFLLF